jgi:hypothetical protein
MVNLLLPTRNHKYANTSPDFGYYSKNQKGTTLSDYSLIVFYL